MQNGFMENLSFIKGFAQQEYTIAEEGIIRAYNNKCTYWYIDGSIESDAPSNWNDNRIEELLKAISTYNVKPIYHGNFKVPLASDVEELRETAICYTMKEIDLASSLGAPIIIHGEVVVEPRLISQVKKKAIESYCDSIKRLSDYANKKNVEIYLENLSNYKNYRPFHYIFTHEEEFDYVLSRIDHVALFLDIGHANVCNGNPLNLINKYHKRIIGMSFSNNNGMHDQHLALRQGTINFEEILKAIIANNWSGIVGFETRGKNTIASIMDLQAIYQKVIGTSYPFVNLEQAI